VELAGIVFNFAKPDNISGIKNTFFLSLPVIYLFNLNLLKMRICLNSAKSVRIFPSAYNLAPKENNAHSAHWIEVPFFYIYFLMSAER